MKLKKYSKQNLLKTTFLLLRRFIDALLIFLHDLVFLLENDLRFVSEILHLDQVARCVFNIEIVVNVWMMFLEMLSQVNLLREVATTFFASGEQKY